MSQQEENNLDLLNCASEPIHIPGSIQPHGMLFVVEDQSYRILQVSSNTQSLVGHASEALLQQPLDLFLDSEAMETLRNTAREQLERNPLFLFTVTFGESPQVFDGVVHVIDNLLVLELEPVAKPIIQPVILSRLYATVQSAFAQLQHSSTVDQLSQRVVALVRGFTGFDRVMMYRFATDGHGVVIAEEKREDLEPFLDLHYPASDIPTQARSLYIQNWLRLIPDIHYRPVPLLPALNPSTERTLDMSHSVLRSVSPIHIEYLTNMGVYASMSISVVQNNQLWGLIACHHYSPKYVAYDQRTACELIGRVMSLQLPTVAEQEMEGYLAHMVEVRTRLIEQVSSHDTLEAALITSTPSLLDAVKADGAAVCSQERCLLIGQTPESAEVLELVDWLAQRSEQTVYSTNYLSSEYAPAQAWTAVASGLLALVISKEQHRYLLWFRPAVEQTVEWGGKPTKVTTETEQGIRLSPRKSFEKWSQIVHGQSLPWEPAELKNCLLLRNGIVDLLAHRAEQLRRLNQALERSNAELDAFTYSASHDLKEPLRGIHNYAHFLLEDYEQVLGPEGVEQLQTISRLSERMEDLLNSLLYYSQLGRVDLAMRPTDVGVVVQEALSLLQYRIQESATQVRLPSSFPSVYGDPSRVDEVFQNLIANALKYNNKEVKWIEIGFLKEASRPDGSSASSVFFVRDNGIGIPPHHFETVFRIYKRLHGRNEFGGGTGVGLAIVKKIVELHGGTIWIDSLEGEGTTFYFTFVP